MVELGSEEKPTPIITLLVAAVGREVSGGDLLFAAQKSFVPMGIHHNRESSNSLLAVEQCPAIKGGADPPFCHRVSATSIWSKKDELNKNEHRTRVGMARAFEPTQALIIDK
ncbi:hypothetical protein SDJN02_15495, partial [Cucurbita argyrosperma subsp. argyrosperma]